MMKLKGTSNLGKAVCVCLILAFIIAGCQGQKSDNTSLKMSTQTEQMKMQQSEVQTLPGSEPSKPVYQPVPVKEGKDAKDIQLGSETGSPKEEATVPDAVNPVKLSTLKPIYSLGKGKVAITIDDGPTRYTKELLKVLRENDVKVTFFFLGQNASTYPQAVTEAVYDGNEVGYHSNSHPNMSKMTYSQQKTEFDLGLGTLQKLDTQPVRLFRPPYGAYNNDTKLLTEEHNMSMVLWDEDPRDWATINPTEVVKHVLAQVQSGGIIVMHDHPSTIAALPGIIKGIKNKGLHLVTVSSGF